MIDLHTLLLGTIAAAALDTAAAVAEIVGGLAVHPPRWLRRASAGAAWFALSLGSAVLAARLAAPLVSPSSRDGRLTDTTAATLAATCFVIASATRDDAPRLARGSAALAFAALSVAAVSAPWPMAAWLSVPVSFVVATAAAAFATRWRHHLGRHLRPAFVGLVLASLAVGAAAHRAPVDLEVAGTPRNAFVVPASTKAPEEPETLSGGVVTSALAASGRAVELQLHGVFRASLPNFHQVVHVLILLGSSPGPRVLIRAAGVPQPNGSLALVGSHVLLDTGRAFLDGTGRLRVFAPDALIATLRLDHHAWSMLVSLQPTGNDVVSATVTLWPASPSTRLYLS